MPKYEFRCESCKKSFEVVLTTAERATANVQCPTCGSGEVTPQMAIFTVDKQPFHVIPDGLQTFEGLPPR